MVFRSALSLLWWWSDVAILVLILGYYAWLWHGVKPPYDLDMFVQSTRAGLTATSILLPATILVGTDLIEQGDLQQIHVFIAALWFFIAILAAVMNLFRLPTLIPGQAEADQRDRLNLTDRTTVFIGLIQLTTIVLGGVRIIIGVTIA